MGDKYRVLWKSPSEKDRKIAESISKVACMGEQLTSITDFDVDFSSTNRASEQNPATAEEYFEVKPSDLEFSDGVEALLSVSQQVATTDTSAPVVIVDDTVFVAADIPVALGSTRSSARDAPSVNLDSFSRQATQSELPAESKSAVNVSSYLSYGGASFGQQFSSSDNNSNPPKKKTKVNCTDDAATVKSHVSTWILTDGIPDFSKHHLKEKGPSKLEQLLESITTNNDDSVPSTGHNAVISGGVRALDGDHSRIISIQKEDVGPTDSDIPSVTNVNSTTKSNKKRKLVDSIEQATDFLRSAINQEKNSCNQLDQVLYEALVGKDGNSIRKSSDEIALTQVSKEPKDKSKD